MAKGDQIQATARVFLVRIDDSTRVEVRVTSFEDNALPTPHERPEWKARRPTWEEIRAAAKRIAFGRGGSV